MWNDLILEADKCKTFSCLFRGFQNVAIRFTLNNFFFLLISRRDQVWREPFDGKAGIGRRRRRRLSGQVTYYMWFTVKFERDAHKISLEVKKSQSIEIEFVIVGTWSWLTATAENHHVPDDRYSARKTRKFRWKRQTSCPHFPDQKVWGVLRVSPVAWRSTENIEITSIQ